MGLRGSEIDIIPWTAIKNNGIFEIFSICFALAAAAAAAKLLQSCPTLSNPMECSPPGSSVHGIFQARVLEWGAIAFSDFLPLNYCN